MKLTRIFTVLALILAFAVPAYAETQNVKVSGDLEAYWFSRNNFDLQKGNDIGVIGLNPSSFSPAGGSSTQRSEADQYFMSITQIQIAADLTNNVSTVINVINQRDWNADTFTSAFSGVSSIGANEFDLNIDLAYVQMKEIFYAPLTLTIGRQDLVFGRGFIIGWNPQDTQSSIQADEFTQVQSFDAIRATLDFNPWTIDLVYSKIREASNNPEDDRDLYITNINYKFAEYSAVAEAYYVAEIDRNSLVGSVAPFATKDNTTHTIGGRVQFDPISQITLGAELAYQFGDYRSSNSVSARDREAWATDIFGTYRWDNTWKPELTLEYVLLSGENDLSAASKNSYGAWNGPFRGPTYGWIHEYLETYYGTAQTNDQSSGQNMQHVSVTGSISPLSDLKLSAVYYYIWAPENMHTTTTDPSSGVMNSEMGSEIDTQVTYAYTEDVTFTLMADWFIPGAMYDNGKDATASQYVASTKVTF